MKRKQCPEAQLPPKKKLCTNIPVVPKCISTIFAPEQVKTLYQFWEEIQIRYCIPNSTSTPEFDTAVDFLKNSLVVFPIDKELFGKKPRLPLNNISLLIEQTTTEVIHQAISFALKQPFSSKLRKNIITYGFQSENYRTSKKII